MTHSRMQRTFKWQILIGIAQMCIKYSLPNLSIFIYTVFRKIIGRNNNEKALKKCIVIFLIPYLFINKDHEYLVSSLTLFLLSGDADPLIIAP